MVVRENLSTAGTIEQLLVSVASRIAIPKLLWPVILSDQRAFISGCAKIRCVSRKQP